MLEYAWCGGVGIKGIYRHIGIKLRGSINGCERNY